VALVASLAVWWTAVGYLWKAIAAPVNPPQTRPLVVGTVLLALVIVAILAAGWRGGGSASPRGEDRSRSTDERRQSG